MQQPTMKTAASAVDGIAQVGQAVLRGMMHPW